MQDIRIHRGDIFWVRQDYTTVGAEIRKNRPAVIVSNEKNNAYSDTVEIVYLTTAEKKPMPTHVTIETMGKQSTVLCEGIYTVDKGRLENYYCTLTDSEMKLVDQAVLVSLGLTAPPYWHCSHLARIGRIRKGLCSDQRAVWFERRISRASERARYAACSEGNLREDLRRRASSLAEVC